MLSLNSCPIIQIRNLILIIQWPMEKKGVIPLPASLISALVRWDGVAHGNPSFMFHSQISLFHKMYPVRWRRCVGESRQGSPGALTQQAVPLCSPCWRGSLLQLSHGSEKKKKTLHQPFLITRKRPISKMPADFHIPPPSSLKHDVISPLQYNKYFTFKSRFIKRSPGGRNNKVSLYSPNKTAKDIFYNLYFWLWVEIIHISFSVRGPKWCCISRLAEE